MSSKAARFIELIEDGKIRKDVLPNTAEDYTVSQEKQDYENYCFFLNSFLLDDFMKCKAVKYRGDEQI